MTPKTGTEIPSLAGAAWLKSIPLSKVIAALSAAGGEVRAIGGAVRNTLSGRPITDIDLATPLVPAEVIARAKAAGLAVHPTGLDHGTVTIVADEVPFEVTTLRRDVETDGRRAVVAYSTDWREDAERRDFTINALYATPDGEVFDYFGGVEDLHAGRVRFIGDPEARIREDYLRILRFFRFNAEYGSGSPDPQGLAACTSLKDGIARISAERIGAEMMKLIAAPRASEIVEVMAGANILTPILGADVNPGRLKRLMDIERANQFAPDRWTRLAALALDSSSDAAKLVEIMRLSKLDRANLEGAATLHPALDPVEPESAAKAQIYRAGADAFRRSTLVAWARSSDGPHDAMRKKRATLADRWAAPMLPVRGADVLALGIKKGSAVGEILKRFEMWWIAADFPTDPALHKKKLSEFAHSY